MDWITYCLSIFAFFFGGQRRHVDACHSEARHVLWVSQTLLFDLSAREGCLEYERLGSLNSPGMEIHSLDSKQLGNEPCQTPFRIDPFA
jgi:hypothetical protein